MGIFKKFCDNRQPRSWSSRLRKKRHEQFLLFLNRLNDASTILDVGGTAGYWKSIGFKNDGRIKIFLLNLERCQHDSVVFSCIVGDMRDMRQFSDGAFDVVFSNSTIEHLTTLEDQMRAAREIRRVGKAHFIQTPNYYFPLEPHFLFPFFQFFPLGLKVFLVRHFHLGWFKRRPRKEDAEELVRSIRLLRRKELIELFPGDVIDEEKVLGFVKSFIIKNPD